jgi:hypothetical protein
MRSARLLRAGNMLRRAAAPRAPRSGAAYLLPSRNAPRRFAARRTRAAAPVMPPRNNTRRSRWRSSAHQAAGASRRAAFRAISAV